MSNNSCGIDFGTTNSLIAVCDHDGSSLIKIDDDNTILPTAVFYSKENRLFGYNAIDSYINGEDGRLLRSFKRILGTDLMETGTLINNRTVPFRSVIASFLKEIKTRAENQLNKELTSVVLGRPVHYQNNNPAADNRAEEEMRIIAESVGFKDIVFQYEPIAAAFAHEQTLRSNKIALVADLGGGTSDFTIIKLGPSHLNNNNRKDDILSTSGIRIGGNDFDRDLTVYSFMPQFGRGTHYGPKHLRVPEFLFLGLAEWSRINFMYIPKNIHIVQEILQTADEPLLIENLLELLEMQQAHHLLQVSESCKINLTQHDSVKSNFDGISKNLSFEISRKSFDSFVQQECDAIIKTIKDCLQSAQIKPDQIDMLILTGGTSKIPLVQSNIRTLFPNAFISDNQRMESVALGLAHMANKIF